MATAVAVRAGGSECVGLGLSGLALAALPVTFAAGLLTLPVVLLVVAVAGCATVVFEAADLNLAITLVEPETIGSARAAVQGTLAVAGVIGPGVAGVLVAAFRASGAVVVDAASYLVSAVAMLLVHPGAREPVIRSGSLRTELLAGLRQLRRARRCNQSSPTASRPTSQQRRGRQPRWSSPSATFTSRAVSSVSRSAIGFAGAPVGAATSQRMAAAIGVGPLLIVGSILEGAGLLAASFAQHGTAAVPLFARGGFFVGTVGLLWFNVQSVTLRQRTTPPSILGRVNSSANLVVYAAIPLGGTLGGFLADRIGARQALLSASVVMLAVVLLLAVPRIRQLRVMRTRTRTGLVTRPTRR